MARFWNLRRPRIRPRAAAHPSRLRSCGFPFALEADILKHMHKLLPVLALATFATISAAQTPGSAETAVLTPIRQFVDGFNKGDTKMMLAVCADQTSILDEFPPHEWHGTG